MGPARAPGHGVAALLLVLAIAAAAALLPDSARGSDVSRAAAYLISQQNPDGGWGPSPSSASSTTTTAWAMLGLEAAGHNPLDVSRAGRDPVAYLRGQVDELSTPGDFARTVLALEGAGIDPRDFGGRDLVAALAKRRRDNGSFEGWPGSTAFAVIALRAAGAGGTDASVSWLVKVQSPDGGWGDVPGSPSTADGTGAVLQAIPGTEAASHGMGYLRNVQRPNGGFALGGTGSVNSQSTAWAAQGALAVGRDPASLQVGGNSPLDYLAARQDPDGHYRYSASSDQTPIWVTAQVLSAVAGESFPIAPVPREAPATGATEGGEASGGASIPPVAPETGSTGGSVSPQLPVPPGAGVAPSTGGTTPSIEPPGAGIAPAPPPTAAPEGETAEPPPTAPAAPPFQAGDNSSDPLPPAGVGLATAGFALGSVLLLGRRFGW